GWGNIIDLMSKTGPLGSYAGARPGTPIITEYRDELVAFLTKYRGPDSPPLKYKPAPRPTGDAAKAVITENDLPPGEARTYFPVHTGTDGSRGTRPGSLGRPAHDVAITPDGNIWFTDQGNPERTIGVVDTKTGHVKGYKLARQSAESDQAQGEGGAQGAR